MFELGGFPYRNGGGIVEGRKGVDGDFAESKLYCSWL